MLSVWIFCPKTPAADAIFICAALRYLFCKLECYLTLLTGLIPSSRRDRLPMHSSRKLSKSYRPHVVLPSSGQVAGLQKTTCLQNNYIVIKDLCFFPYGLIFFRIFLRDAKYSKPPAKVPAKLYLLLYSKWPSHSHPRKKSLPGQAEYWDLPVRSQGFANWVDRICRYDWTFFCPESRLLAAGLIKIKVRCKEAIIANQSWIPEQVHLNVDSPFNR